MNGSVEEILVSATAASLPSPVGRTRAIAGVGLEGDRYATGLGYWSDYPVETGRALTLIEAEVLELIGLTSAEARRNIVTRGIRLDQLVGRRFRVGAIECYGDRLCEPCTHLAFLTGVGIEKLVHRGGLRADVLTDGEITVGDPIIVE